MANILVVDDDGHIREIVRFALEKVGHRVFEAADGRAALATFREQPIDVVVLDIIIPEQDGLDVCRKLRERSQVPILFLSSRDDEIDRVLGLEIGADDYVTKPFSPREVVARVKALLRRATAVTDAAEAVALRRGELVLDSQRFTCTWGESPVLLTATEFGLLRSLMGSAGRVYTRGEVVERAWGYGHHITERTVDSHIRRIRRKFSDVGGDQIEIVHGSGCRLRT